MLLSIIIPVYNVEKYIEECVSSCADQDIDRSTYEIICVNDGSTDSSLDKLLYLAEKHPNVVIINQENFGVSKARNVGLTAAKGEYVWFVDGDDYIASNILKKVTSDLSTLKPDRALIQSYCFWEELSDNERKLKSSGKLTSNYPNKRTMATRTIYNRLYLESHHITYNESVNFGEDTLFNYKTRLYKNLTIKIDILAYYYRKSINSATRSPDKEKKKTMDTALKSAVVLEEAIYDYNERINRRESSWMIKYWLSAMLNSYSQTDETFFTQNYSWDSSKLKVSPLDLNLYALNKSCGEIKTFDDLLNKSTSIKKKEKAREKKRQSFIKTRNNLKRIIRKIKKKLNRSGE